MAIPPASLSTAREIVDALEQAARWAEYGSTTKGLETPVGDYSPPETPAQKVQTLRKMVADDSHRLSINERAAIRYALRLIAKKE